MSDKEGVEEKEVTTEDVVNEENTIKGQKKKRPVAKATPSKKKFKSEEPPVSEENDKTETEEDEEMPLGLLDRSPEMTGTRTRKQVERLTINTPAASEKPDRKKYEQIPGKGVKLGTSPRIASQLMVGDNFDVGESLTAGSLEDEDVHSETAVRSLEQENTGNGNDEDDLVEAVHARISRFHEEAAALLLNYLETLQLELRAIQTSQQKHNDNFQDIATTSRGNCQSQLYEETIKTNKELAEAVQGILQDLQKQKLINQTKHQDSSEERSKTDHPIEKNVPKVVTQLSFSQFGFPYFKDKNGEALSVYKDIAAQSNMRFEPIRDFSKPLKMNENQEAKLEEAVLKDLVRIAKEKLTSSKEEVEKVLTDKKAAGMPHKTWLNKLEMLEERINKVGEKPERWFKNSDVYQFDLIDWKMIALEVFPKNIGYDGRFLRQWWRCNLDPSFLRGPLGTKEIGLLKNLTKDSNPENGIDFEAIAAEISTKLKTQKRHKFQLFQYYQKKLNMKNRTFGWTKAEEERLQNLFKEKSMDPNMRKRQDIWNEIRPAFPGRSVSQMETKLIRLSTPAKSPAKCLPAAIKTVVTASKTPRGRPKKPEKSALHLKIAKLSSLYKPIRRGNRRITSLPGDGRRNGLILSAIQRLMPLNTDQEKIPREASELVAAGIAEKDVGTVEVMLSLPESNLNSKISFPPNLASLTGLRGLMLSLEGTSQSVEGEQGISETEVKETRCLGDPVEDQKLLLALDKCFGSWARPFFDMEAPFDGAVVDLPPSHGLD